MANIPNVRSSQPPRPPPLVLLWLTVVNIEHPGQQSTTEAGEHRADVLKDIDFVGLDEL